jgi:5-methylcytosine-specific restriction endonuclease McrA
MTAPDDRTPQRRALYDDLRDHMLANAEANGVHDDPAFSYIVTELLPGWIPEIQRSLIKKHHARRRTDAIRTNGPVEPYTTEEIGERDGWICGVCRDPIDPTLEHPHPLSPSKDHIVPIALGGTDTGDNMWITHWGCNHERNASPIPPEHEAKARLARRVAREQERDASHSVVELDEDPRGRGAWVRCVCGWGGTYGTRDAAENAARNHLAVAES